MLREYCCMLMCVFLTITVFFFLVLFSREASMKKLLLKSNTEGLLLLQLKKILKTRYTCRGYSVKNFNEILGIILF